MKEITLEKIFSDYEKEGFYPEGSKHGIKISYKDWFKTFYDFCEYVKRSGYIIL